MPSLSLDEILFSTNAGAVDADTLRVHLSNESLAALENISVTISGSDLDIRDLTHVSDSIKVGDGTDLMAVNADGSINVVKGGGASIKNSTSSVTTTVGEVVSTPLAGRTAIIIQNEGTASVYVGFDNTVTAANGLKISKSSSLSLDVTAVADIWMIAASGSQDIRFLEVA